MGLWVSGSEDSQNKKGHLACGFAGLVNKMGPLNGIRGIRGH